MTGYLTYAAVSARNDDLRRDADLYRRAEGGSDAAHGHSRAVTWFTYPISRRARAA